MICLFVLLRIGDHKHKRDILPLGTNERMNKIPPNNKHIEMLVQRNNPTTLDCFCSAAQVCFHAQNFSISSCSGSACL